MSCFLLFIYLIVLVNFLFSDTFVPSIRNCRVLGYIFRSQSRIIGGTKVVSKIKNTKNCSIGIMSIKVIMPVTSYS